MKAPLLLTFQAFLFIWRESIHLTLFSQEMDDCINQALDRWHVEIVFCYVLKTTESLIPEKWIPLVFQPPSNQQPSKKYPQYIKPYPESPTTGCLEKSSEFAQIRENCYNYVVCLSANKHTFPPIHSWKKSSPRLK